MINNQSPCKKDCLERSAECRISCERYKEYSAQKAEEYAKRARTLDSMPDSPKKKKQANRNAMNKMRGR